MIKKLDKKILSTVLASEIAALAIDEKLDKDLYDEVYNFLLKKYIEADEKVLMATEKKILS